MAEERPGSARTRPRFGRPTVRDAISGFVTGLFSIPEGMAYASIGGFAAPLGLWSGIVPTIIGSVFARTVLMVTTLTSAIALTSSSVLAQAGIDPGDIGAIATMTVMTGVVMLAMGLLRLGSVMSFVSTAVMTGFTTGIAVQIVAGVIGDATGYVPDSANTVGKLVDAVLHVGQWDAPTVAIAAATVAVWAVVRIFRRLRALATLIALLVVSIGVAVVGATVELVSDIAEIPRSLPPVTLPDPSAIPALATGAVAIALVALAQAAGISAAVANPDGSRSDASKDFSAQGVANIAGGVFGALPTGGSLSRTGVATSAGAQTRWSGIFAGIWLAVIVLAVGPLAGQIPMAVIGGLMIVIGAELVLGRRRDIVLVATTSWLSLIAMIATFVATTALPLQQAIFIGAGISIVLTSVEISRIARLSRFVRTPDGGWEVEDVPEVLPDGQTTVLHYLGVGFFAEVDRVRQFLPDTAGARDAAIVLSLRGAIGVPSATFLKAFEHEITALREQRIPLVVCGVDPAVRRRLARSGALASIGEENVIAATPRLAEALDLAYDRAERLRVEASA